MCCLWAITSSNSIDIRTICILIHIISEADPVGGCRGCATLSETFYSKLQEYFPLFPKSCEIIFMGFTSSWVPCTPLKTILDPPLYTIICTWLCVDLIAIPDFAAGAMENWGLITYRSTSLLFDEKESSDSNKQWVATVVAHELAHQVCSHGNGSV